MVSPMRTEFQVTDMRRREALAAVDRYRSVLDASVDGGEPAASASPLRGFGAALSRLGRHLPGTRPVDPAVLGATPAGASPRHP